MPVRNIDYAAGNYYHLYNRGAGRQSIFREEENYLFILGKIKRYMRELQLAVIAYCLMPNHYHLLVRQDGEPAAGLLAQRVFNSYVKAFNKRYQRSGTLFEDRYKAVLVDKEAYLLHLCRYIHGNPVKDGLVAGLADWPYSNYHEWIGARSGSLVDRAFVEAYFQNGPAYTAFVESYLTDLDPLPEGVRAYLF